LAKEQLNFRLGENLGLTVAIYFHPLIIKTNNPSGYTDIKGS
jgi:hypothetical protein